MAWHYTYDIHTVQEVRNNLMDISWHDTSLLIFMQIAGLKDVLSGSSASAGAFLLPRFWRDVCAGRCLPARIFVLVEAFLRGSDFPRAFVMDRFGWSVFSSISRELQFMPGGGPR